MGFSLLDHRDNPSEGGISSHLRDLEANAAKGGNSCCIDTTSTADLDRHRLPGQSCLIDGRLPADHLSIHRNRLAWTDNHRLTNLHLLNGNDLFYPLAFYPRRLGSQCC